MRCIHNMSHELAFFFRNIPARRMRKFREGVDKESDRFSEAYPDFVEVPSHIQDGDGGIVPNPEYQTAEFEEGYLALPD